MDLCCPTSFLDSGAYELLQDIYLSRVVFFLHSPLDNAEGRLSAASTKCAEGVPGKWTDQVLYIRQPNHCAGRSTPQVFIGSGKASGQCTCFGDGN